MTAFVAGTIAEVFLTTLYIQVSLVSLCHSDSVTTEYEIKAEL